MRSIGVVAGESAWHIFSMLSHIAGNVDISPGICEICGPRPEKLDMLIINSHTGNTLEFLKYLSDSSVVLINSDEKKLNRQVANFAGRVISYGFNQKACVTASSVEENEYMTVQCCIQRLLPTFSGSMLEQQEFSVSAPIAGADAISVLAYAAAAIVNDISIDDISGNRISAP